MLHETHIYVKKTNKKQKTKNALSYAPVLLIELGRDVEMKLWNFPQNLGRRYANECDLAAKRSTTVM